MNFLESKGTSLYISWTAVKRLGRCLFLYLLRFYSPVSGNIAKDRYNMILNHDLLFAGNASCPS